MKRIKLILVLALVTAMFTRCSEDRMPDVYPADGSNLKSGEKPQTPNEGMFTVVVENVSVPYDYFEAGAQFIPDGENSPGPAFPGQSFTIRFHAGKGHRLSFASMYGASNDLFYAPSDDGIALFTGSTPLTGDITSMISLWDAGTEENHAPASGEPGDEENEPIQSVRNTDNVMDGFNYNNVEENIRVSLDYDGVSMFTLTVGVLETSGTPLSPVAWVVHYDNQMPVFNEGEFDYGHGLEDLAETGNAAPLSEYLKMHSGYVSPIAPGIWVVHKKGQRPIFTEGNPDYGIGLEALAETGNPADLFHTLMQNYVSGVYNTVEGTDEMRPIFPGESYTFTFEAKQGEYLSFASMLGKSNDLFFAPGDMGIKLFEGNKPVEGVVTAHVYLWDAGTEPNEYPGAGIHQGPGGTEENGVVEMVDDQFTYPHVNQMIKVSISKN